MKPVTTPREELQPAQPASSSRPDNPVLGILLWGVAGAMLLVLVGVLLARQGLAFPMPVQAGSSAEVLETLPASTAVSASLPPLQVPKVDSVLRASDLHTSIPSRARETVEEYTVEMGDSLFAIAKSFNLEPESLLWANYDTLKDNPEYLAPGMVLKVPPTDGILYKWKSGDSVDRVAAQFNAEPINLLAWPGNDLDMANPQIPPDSLVMIPGGSREFVSWIVPTIPRGRAGVNTNIPGTCDTGEGGLIGGGAFMWPTPNTHVLSGNDYWSGHLGIDIAAGEGTPIYAADSGVVVYSGGIGGGYGIMVMVDHGNGWQTLYAHLSKTAVRCGASVAQGSVIAYSGNSGNSTGPHLHFEVRYLGGFVNPWSVVN